MQTDTRDLIRLDPRPPGWGKSMGTVALDALRAAALGARVLVALLAGWLYRRLVGPLALFAIVAFGLAVHFVLDGRAPDALFCVALGVAALASIVGLLRLAGG